MTIYLTKVDGDQMHHFRLTVQANGIFIVAGQFYHYLLSLFHGIGLPANQVTEKEQHKLREMAEEFVRRQIDDGYVLTPYVETKENTIQVYDNAKFHYEGNFPEELDIRQAYVHTGLFLGWLIERNLINEAYFAEFKPALEAFRKREMTGPVIFEILLGGELAIEMLSEQGNRFAITYFDFIDGQYLHDYRHVLALNETSVYHVADSWENYELMKQVIDQRYAAWLDQTRIDEAVQRAEAPIVVAKRPWWQIF